VTMQIQRAIFSLCQIANRPGSTNNPATDVIHNGGKKHQQSKKWIRPAVKQITKKGKQQISAANRHQIVEAKTQRKKIKQKKMGRKNHYLKARRQKIRNRPDNTFPDRDQTYPS